LTEDAEWKRISPEYFVFYRPKDVVSGDFFWAFHAEQENISVWVAADCTGHGVPGAFMSMLGIGFLNEIVIEGKTLVANQILDKLREKIIKALQQKNALKQRKDGIDMALCVWDKNTGYLEFAGANNPLYIIRPLENLPGDDADRMIEKNEHHALLELNADKMPVGLHTGEIKPFSLSRIKLVKGDIIYSFSDGLPDQFGGEQGKKFKYKQFRQVLLKSASKPFEQTHSYLETSYDDWKSDFEQIDDVCVIGIKITQ